MIDLFDNDYDNDCDNDLNPESFSSPLACGAAGRRCPTSREAPFLKLTVIGAVASPSSSSSSSSSIN